MAGISEIDAATLAQWLREDRDFRLIDVRSDQERAQGMIPKGEALALPHLALRSRDLAGAQALVVYCRTGIRSAQACRYLLQRGFDNLYNLRGGVTEWVHKGFALL